MIEVKKQETKNEKQETNNYEVVVIGGGPAGLSCALELAKNNIKVLLLEKKHYPREKVCGDGLTYKSLNFLRDLGFSEDFFKKKIFSVEKVLVFSPKNKQAIIKLKPKNNLARCGVISRKIFDNLLYQKVKNLGVNIYTASEVLKIKNKKNYVLIKFHHKSKKQIKTLKSKIAVVAVGAVSKNLTNHQPLKFNKNLTFLSGRAYFKLKIKNSKLGIRNYASIHYENYLLPVYAWIFPESSEILNVGISVLWSKKEKEKKPLQYFFNKFIQQNRYAKNILGEQLSAFKSSVIPLNFNFNKIVKDKILYVGDAGGFVDPLTGEGIYGALKSGKLAAQTITKVLQNNLSYKQLKEYSQKAKKEFRQKYFYFAILLNLMKYPQVLEIVIERAKVNPFVRKALVKILDGTFSFKKDYSLFKIVERLLYYFLKKSR